MMLLALLLCLGIIAAVAVLRQRRRAQVVLRDRVAAAVAEQRAYEVAHGARQHERLHKHDLAVAPKHGGTGSRRLVLLEGGVRLQREHGHYDPDQREESVLLRVRYTYRLAKEKPPAELLDVVREQLAGGGS